MVMKYSGSEGDVISKVGGLYVASTQEYCFYDGQLEVARRLVNE